MTSTRAPGYLSSQLCSHSKAAGDEAKVRHLETELNSLKEYKEHNPDDKHDPTSLELYCDANPEADECRVYDD